MNNIKHTTTIAKDPGDEWTGEHFVVATRVEGLEADRPDLYSIGVKTERLAKRLAAAIGAGAVFYDHHVGTDVNGKTYVHASSRVAARYANADLKRLGY